MSTLLVDSLLATADDLEQHAEAHVDEFQRSRWLRHAGIVRKSAYEMARQKTLADADCPNCRHKPIHVRMHSGIA